MDTPENLPKRGYRDPVILIAGVCTGIASTLNLLNVQRPLAIVVGVVAFILWCVALTKNIRQRRASRQDS